MTLVNRKLKPHRIVTSRMRKQPSGLRIVVHCSVSSQFIESPATYFKWITYNNATLLWTDSVFCSQWTSCKNNTEILPFQRKIITCSGYFNCSCQKTDLEKWSRAHSLGVAERVHLAIPPRRGQLAPKLIKLICVTFLFNIIINVSKATLR